MKARLNTGNRLSVLRYVPGPRLGSQWTRLASTLPTTPRNAALPRRMAHLTETMPRPSGEAIRIEDLHKRFGPLEVLRGVSLTAHEGDVVTLIGGSGSGKSTLLRCVNFLETPSSGKVIIGGEEVRCRGDGTPAEQKQIERLRQSLGMVFQQFNLWTHKTVLENLIEMPVHVLGQPKEQAIARAKQLLDRVGLAQKEDAYPAFLSGGQQQRAAIARALCMQPRAMLFDEPTSALDPELVGEVLAVIRDLATEGRTMLLVTHEMKFAREVSDHVIYLYNGLIEEQGPPDQLFGAPQSPRLKQFLKSVA